MQNKKNQIDAVDVYLEKRKAREYVGRLSREGKKFIFIYNDSYLYSYRAIALGPDLPLTKKKFSSEALFQTFEDRIPSKKNPAYSEYCRMVGIDSSEKDPLTLVATLGQKGPSSFIFSPVHTSSMTSEDILNFRKDLNLTLREFSDLFDFAPATINRIENKAILGKDSLKRLEIYYYFPEVALHEANKNRFKIHEQKIKHVVKYLRSKCKKNEIIKIDPSQKELEVTVLIQDGYFFLSSAKSLFSHPLLMSSGAVLAHHGIELIMKACWIWDKNEYSKTHNLPYIANQISFLKANQNIQDLITKIYTFYHFRYPMDEKVRDKIQEKLDSINDNTLGIPTIAGEIGTYEWEYVDELYRYVIQKMPSELGRLWKKITNKYKNFR
jgi:HipA-like protein